MLLGRVGGFDPSTKREDDRGASRSHEAYTSPRARIRRRPRRPPTTTTTTTTTTSTTTTTTVFDSVSLRSCSSSRTRDSVSVSVAVSVAVAVSDSVLRAAPPRSFTHVRASSRERAQRSYWKPKDPRQRRWSPEIARKFRATRAVSDRVVRAGTTRARDPLARRDEKRSSRDRSRPNPSSASRRARALRLLRLFGRSRSTTSSGRIGPEVS